MTAMLSVSILTVRAQTAAYTQLCFFLVYI